MLRIKSSHNIIDENTMGKIEKHSSLEANSGSNEFSFPTSAQSFRRKAKNMFKKISKKNIFCKNVQQKLKPHNINNALYFPVFNIIKQLILKRNIRKAAEKNSKNRKILARRKRKLFFSFSNKRNQIFGADNREYVMKIPGKFNSRAEKKKLFWLNGKLKSNDKYISRSTKKRFSVSKRNWKNNEKEDTLKHKENYLDNSQIFDIDNNIEPFNDIRRAHKESLMNKYLYIKRLDSVWNNKRHKLFWKKSNRKQNKINARLLRNLKNVAEKTKYSSPDTSNIFQVNNYERTKRSTKLLYIVEVLAIIVMATFIVLYILALIIFLIQRILRQLREIKAKQQIMKKRKPLKSITNIQPTEKPLLKSSNTYRTEMPLFEIDSPSKNDEKELFISKKGPANNYVSKKYNVYENLSNASSCEKNTEEPVKVTFEVNYLNLPTEDDSLLNDQDVDKLG
ncbi:uncharacterized protein LOC111626019 [Centruroides sculpturatus]|uniref:uncharacterized protein LOC111626019 n=1 Tax=Centruroides sculpturatus TaxID=218467 RepID=UPI000C6CF5FD|nr:uncharacterized protein LOC111626019 [Centruroides sculpturatus]